MMTLIDSFASATILKPDAVSARPNLCVINSFTFTLPARINSIDLAVSPGGPAYDIMTELQLRQRYQRFIGVATFGSVGAKKRIVPPPINGVKCLLDGSSRSCTNYHNISQSSVVVFAHIVRHVFFCM